MAARKKAKRRGAKRSTSGARRPIESRDEHVKNLFLDPENPRIPEEYADASQPELLRLIARDFDLLEIARSMADNGYFREEPLIVVPRKGETYTVVEGNRRLATLRLLLKPEEQTKLRLRGWPKVTASTRALLDPVPVIVYERREDVIPYLGFRHISGVMEWEPLAKARFMSQLVRQGESFAAVSREVGVGEPTVRRNYLTYHLLRQASEEYGIDVSRAEQDFSVLFRALYSPPIRKFIGVDDKKTVPQLTRPFPRSRSDEVEELLSWMYGDEEFEPAMRESRQIKELAEVLASKEATEHLRASRDLAYAFSLAGGEERRFLDSLQKASFHLDESLREAHRHKKSAKAKELVARCAETLDEIVRHFPASRGGK